MKTRIQVGQIPALVPKRYDYHNEHNKECHRFIVMMIKCGILRRVEPLGRMEEARSIS